VRAPDRVGLLGHSRGGAGAILRAAAGGVDALVTWAAMAALDRWTPETREEWRAAGRIFVPNTRTGQQMPLDVGLLEDFEADRDRFDVTAAARRVAVPWLVVHGADDETVDPEAARILAGAGPHAQLTIVEEAGHTFGAVHPFAGSGPALDAAVGATRRHFRRHLAPD
jgi:pimeloyl-ACP methyl ester carboxylesterase